MLECEIDANGKTVMWPTPIQLTAAVFTQACNIIASVACVYVIVSILRDRDLRKNTLNLYVVFMLFPDIANTFLTFLAGNSRIRNCGDVPDTLFDVLDFYSFFYYMCNFSLNSVVAWELYKLLDQSRRISRTGPPPMKRTLLSVFCVYSFALVFATWGIVDTSWSWFWREKSAFGSPQPGGLFTEIAAISMVGGLVMGFILFVVAIRIHIWREKLMPKKGRTKMISKFFQRIIVVFLIFYFPNIALQTAFTSIDGKLRSPKKFWMEQAIHFLTALQVLLTLAVVSQKPDIKKSIFFFLHSQKQKPTKRRESFIIDRSSTLVLHNSERSRFFHKRSKSNQSSIFFKNPRTNVSASVHDASVAVAMGDNDDIKDDTSEQATSIVKFVESKDVSTRDQQTIGPACFRDQTDDFLFQLQNQERRSKHLFKNKLEENLRFFSEWEMDDVYEMHETEDNEEENPEETTFGADESVQAAASEIICADDETTTEMEDVHHTRESSIVMKDIEDIYDMTNKDTRDTEENPIDQ